MSEAQQKLTPAHIMEAYHNGEDIRTILTALPKDEAEELRTAFATYKKDTEQKVWEAKRKVRNTESKISITEIDKNRTADLVRVIGQNLLNTFDGAYKNSQQAARACWQYEQQYGANAAEKVLKSNPEQFGELKGIKILGIPIGLRREALNHIRKLEYTKMRTYFTRSEAAYKKLQRALSN